MNRSERCQRHSDSKKHPLKIHPGRAQPPHFKYSPTEAIHRPGPREERLRWLVTLAVTSWLTCSGQKNDSPVPPLRSPTSCPAICAASHPHHILQPRYERLSVELFLNLFHRVAQTNGGSTLPRRRGDVFTAGPRAPALSEQLAHFQLESA